MNPPAGWNPDPFDPTIDRYWDGQQWTAQTRPKGVDAPTQAFGTPTQVFGAPGSAVPDTNAEEGKTRRKWPWIAGAAVVGAGCHRRGDGSGQVGRIDDACCDLFDDSCSDDNQEHCPVDDEDHDFVPLADDDNDRAATDDNHRGNRAAGASGTGDHDNAVRSARSGLHAAEDNRTGVRSAAGQGA